MKAIFLSILTVLVLTGCYTQLTVVEPQPPQRVIIHNSPTVIHHSPTFHTYYWWTSNRHIWVHPPSTTSVVIYNNRVVQTPHRVTHTPRTTPTTTQQTPRRTTQPRNTTNSSQQRTVRESDGNLQRTRRN